MKRIISAAAIFFALTVQAFCAGTIAFSLSQQLDSSGNPLSGGRLYFYQAGTTTPQSAYSDSALTLPLANPITLDSAGRIPQFFLADGTIKIRLTNSAGVSQVTADGVMVIGASSGTGTGSVVDATTVLATGDLKVRYATGTLSGFVRANGRTIGSASSGATERANADCEELFIHLWTEDANLSVSTGRGATAAADWAANKTIALPDMRGRVIAGLDDMGNSAAGRRTVTYTGVVATALGSVSTTSESHTLTAAQIPSITTSGSNSITVNTLGHVPYATGGGLAGGVPTVSSGSLWAPYSATNSWVAASSFSGTNTITATSNNTSGSAHPTVDPTIFMTTYLKL
ncbi:MAG: hypothetical protein WC807_21930 [Hyphomicrobium sp.]|jgi:microcystin-dependent protein